MKKTIFNPSLEIDGWVNFGGLRDYQREVSIKMEGQSFRREKDITDQAEIIEQKLLPEATDDRNKSHSI